jgi:hypothetical protein
MCDLLVRLRRGHARCDLWENIFGVIGRAIAQSSGYPRVFTESWTASELVGRTRVGGRNSKIQNDLGEQPMKNLRKLNDCLKNFIMFSVKSQYDVLVLCQKLKFSKLF